jgi:hypothetical protein
MRWWWPPALAPLEAPHKFGSSDRWGQGGGGLPRHAHGLPLSLSKIMWLGMDARRWRAQDPVEAPARWWPAGGGPCLRFFFFLSVCRACHSEAHNKDITVCRASSDQAHSKRGHLAVLRHLGLLPFVCHAPYA